MNAKFLKHRDAILVAAEDVGERLAAIVHEVEQLSNDEPSADELEEFLKAVLAGDRWLALNLAPRLFSGAWLAAAESALSFQFRRAA
ncbi:hypothetical protein SAMN05518849_101582 [Sphingobium sp. AP50]|uniref:hypothetical protein n=1 Tax=Sphingobium sp. AP50 TaxID=1884369 RepID=UPI0008BF0614|nr:hypothetical protein [Sphingobium sp. AP50]SEI69401.1 hypothetical protein SAMN05518849_101582 [Sphingobium sp. AP50]